MRRWGTAASILVLTLLLGTASAQGRAYRTINFGDSLAVVASKVKADPGFLNLFGKPVASLSDGAASVDDEVQAGGVYTLIGGQRYRIWFDFYDGKLFRLRILSRYMDANYFGTSVTDLRNNLATVITKAHGAPDQHYSLQFFDMQPYRIAWSDVWKTNPDGVAYYVGIGEGENEYMAALWVEWTSLREQFDAAQNNKQTQQQQKSSKDF